MLTSSFCQQQKKRKCRWRVVLWVPWRQTTGATEHWKSSVEAVSAWMAESGTKNASNILRKLIHLFIYYIYLYLFILFQSQSFIEN
jgi:hypothetical protein